MTNVIIWRTVTFVQDIISADSEVKILLLTVTQAKASGRFRGNIFKQV